MSASSTARPLVRAAGGIVWRSGDGGAPEIVLVYRRVYDDWTFPKGKLHSGESDVDGAIREVLEETGLRCELGAFLGESSYRDSRNRPKSVRYWAMTPAEGELGAANEIDDARWFALDDAEEALSYGRDRTLLDRFRETRWARRST